jgi:AraC family transcriptional regulator
MNASNDVRTENKVAASRDQSNPNLPVELEPPRFEDAKPLLIAGLQRRFNGDTFREIPGLWERFVPYMGNIDGQIGGEAYGVMFGGDGAGSFEYLSGVQVARAERLPAGFTTVSIPAQRYAVFAHRGPVSEIHRTAHAIWTKWLPESGYQAAAAPNFERYPAGFDPDTDHTGVELWIPVKAIS